MPENEKFFWLNMLTPNLREFFLQNLDAFPENKIKESYVDLCHSGFVEQFEDELLPFRLTEEGKREISRISDQNQNVRHSSLDFVRTLVKDEKLNKALERALLPAETSDFYETTSFFTDYSTQSRFLSSNLSYPSSAQAPRAPLTRPTSDNGSLKNERYSFIARKFAHFRNLGAWTIITFFFAATAALLAFIANLFGVLEGLSRWL